MDTLITYPRADNLSACAQAIRVVARVAFQRSKAECVRASYPRRAHNSKRGGRPGVPRPSRRSEGPGVPSVAHAPANCASYPRRDPGQGGPCVSRRLTRRARKLPNNGLLSPHTSAVQAINVGWWCAMTGRASSEVAGAHTLDSSEALPSMAGFLARWWRLTCLQFPRLYLCLSVLHPIRRHYTPSERVRCPLTGALPPNGCVAPQGVSRVPHRHGGLSEFG